MPLLQLFGIPSLRLQDLSLELCCFVAEIYPGRPSPELRCAEQSLDRAMDDFMALVSIGRHLLCVRSRLQPQLIYQW